MIRLIALVAVTVACGGCTAKDRQDFLAGMSRASITVVDGNEVLAQSVIIDDQEIIIQGKRYDPRANRVIRSIRSVLTQTD